MELLEDNIILNLKSRFFDLFDVESGLLRDELLLDAMIGSIKSLLHASEVTLLASSEWNQELVIEASTEKSAYAAAFASIVTSEEYEQLLKGKVVYRSGAPLAVFGECDLSLVFKEEGRIHGFLLIKQKNPGSQSALSDQLLINISKECVTFLKKVRGLSKIVVDEKRYRQLFRITEKLHSSMDMDAVLGEIIGTLKEVYPSFTYYLLLSQDNNSHGDLPVRDLEYDSENIAAMQAYVTGLVQIEDSVQDRKSVLYAPLKGRQGVYGVLQVIAPNTVVFPKNEVEFIMLLSNTAGGALENAQLYQQSRRLISDLQLINETSHQLNSNLRLTETISYMSQQIMKWFDAREAGFILLSEDLEQTEVMQGSSPFYFTEEAKVYIKYIKDKIKKEKDSLFIGDLNLHNGERAPRFKSIMAVPMVQSETLKGFALVMHKQPYHFSFEAFKLLQSLIHHSTLAFTNSMLREELEKMVVTDHLTKLYSRNYLNEKMDMSIETDGQGTFILIDIDDFKSINDTYGHQIGDEVIIQVANIINTHIRSTDIGSRWGGEELAIYLPKAPLEAGVVIAERLVEKVAENTSPQITISCGVSHWNSEKSDTSINLFKRADRALYLAKGSGKNKVVIQKEESGTILGDKLIFK
ncbi:GGDEF domain-containing protein [Bacillus canaveralius]|uniref:GGDEF domain-containing protein n=1 Tax=Bacillus canaveralius TaxID=1403243 RepID=A0A2N5GN74_9BACI|nr:sensor domain-containing diguanylate cyclase [Bacillus canaveralius]PLR83706.1 GGDEF domain-containing protein [Bacillus canaveralius]PLR95192.1 GGDEF domain-containing protein [Bacillus canaveralius]